MQSRVAKLEAVMSIVATREDLARLEVKLHQEISGIHRDITHIHQALKRANLEDPFNIDLHINVAGKCDVLLRKKCGVEHVKLKPLTLRLQKKPKSA
jgi:hypothetical protein